MTPEADHGLSSEERDTILARLRADRARRRGAPIPLDPIAIWREVVASQALSGIDALPHVPVEYREQVRLAREAALGARKQKP